MKIRTFVCFLGGVLVIYTIFFLFFSESLQTTEDTARKLAVGAAITEFGFKEYKITLPVYTFQDKRKNIEEHVPFFRKYQRKYYHHVLIENGALRFSIMYTIDGKNGNLISRSYGNEVIFYSTKP
jgi:hypothetical protein